MNITVLNGSPRKRGNTAAMIRAFVEGSLSAGHGVEVIDVHQMEISGCLGCEHCHNSGGMRCVLEDDMQGVYASLELTEVLVLASPVYFYNITGPLQSAISRIYALGKPANLVKCGMLLSSRVDGVYDGIVEIHRAMARAMGIEDIGVVTSKGSENATPERREEMIAMGLASRGVDEDASRRKLDEIRAFGKRI